MAEVAQQFGFRVKQKNGKLCIEKLEDVDLMVKLLAEYYKEGWFSVVSTEPLLGLRCHDNALIPYLYTSICELEKNFLPFSFYLV